MWSGTRLYSHESPVEITTSFPCRSFRTTDRKSLFLRPLTDDPNPAFYRFGDVHPRFDGHIPRDLQWLGRGNSNIALGVPVEVCTSAEDVVSDDVGFPN